MTAEEFYNDFKEALQVLNIPWGQMKEVGVFVDGSVVKYYSENKMYTIDYTKR